MIEINIIWKAKSFNESQIQNRTKTSSFLLHNTQKVQLSQWTTQFWFNMEENEVLQLEPPSHAKVKKMYMVFQQLFTVHNRLPLVGLSKARSVLHNICWIMADLWNWPNEQPSKIWQVQMKKWFLNHLTTFITDMKVSFLMSLLYVLVVGRNVLFHMLQKWQVSFTRFYLVNYSEKCQRLAIHKSTEIWQPHDARQRARARLPIGVVL